VGILPRAPGGLLARIGREAVAAGPHDGFHLGSPGFPDVGQDGLAAGILRGVVQQGRDGLVLIGAEPERQATDRQGMGEVGDPGALTELVPVEGRA
jgi:hypothetical protein